MGATEQDKKIALQIKDRIAKPYAPFVWLGLQLTILACLSVACDPAGSPTPDGWLISVAIGVAFAPLLSSLRRERWVRQPGVEDSDGALERLLVDAALGSYALPAPWEWRASERTWQLGALATESLASVNYALFWHAGVQHSVVASTASILGEGFASTTLGVFAVALCAVLRAAYFYDDALDGLPAELEAAARLSSRAESYYGMTMAADVQAAALSTRTTNALNEAWARKFGRKIGGNTKFAQLALAFASAAACALAYELTGEMVATPALALAVSAMDTYVLRPDPELTRVRVELSDVA